MEQKGRVAEVRGDGTALVLVERRSACSGDCDHCGGCASFKQELKAEAINAIGAQVGDRVVLETGSGSVLGAAALVYLLPIVTFFLGYALGASFDFRPGLCGLGGTVLGFVPILLAEKSLAKKKKIISTIVRLEEI